MIAIGIIATGEIGGSARSADRGNRRRNERSTPAHEIPAMQRSGIHAMRTMLTRTISN
jgi:hypothetical protein